MASAWSKPEVTSHPVGPWSLPQATAWRQAAPRQWQEGGPEPALLAAPTLTSWLQESGRAASLRVVVAVGGGQAMQAWLGLSLRAETERAAALALASSTADLGALLDAWHWFDQPDPQAPPPLAEQAPWLADATGDSDALLDAGGGWGVPTLPSVLEALAEYPYRLALHVELTPAIGDVDLVRSAGRTARQAIAGEGGAPHWEPDPLTERALRLHGQVTASLLRVRLDGLPPDQRAVRTWLSRALSYDLGGDLVFADDPRPLRVHGSRTQRLLEIATSPSPRAMGGDLDDAHDDIPF